MLTGIYTYSIDQKGRIVMPGRFLDEIGNPFVMGGHPSGYLVAASSPDLLEDKNSIRGFVECQIKDRTGRFVIPSALREFAELNGSGEATVVGVGDEVEIWNKRRWESVARLGGAAMRTTPDDAPSGRARRSPRESGGAVYGAPSSASPQASFYQQFDRGQAGAGRRGTFAPERIGVQQKSIYGQPYIEIDGNLSFAETDKVLARIDSALRGRPRTIFLDLRRVDTVDASFLMAMEPTTYQLAANGGKLAILTERQDVAALIHRLCNSSATRVFPDLEAALWWLVDEGHA